MVKKLNIFKTFFINKKKHKPFFIVKQNDIQIIFNYLHNATAQGIKAFFDFDPRKRTPKTFTKRNDEGYSTTMVVKVPLQHRIVGQSHNRKHIEIYNLIRFYP